MSSESRDGLPADEPHAVPFAGPANDSIPPEGELSEQDLEAAYRQALEAVEAVESEYGPAEIESETAVVEAGASSEEPAANRDADSAADPFGPVSRIDPRQIIEATLFVGGMPLTIKKLCQLLRGEFDQEFVEGVIDELNAQYARERRPYEIVFGEGGYRLALRPEFEPLRSRAFGIGPKEVKLSQDALEVLAVVAYRQPISREEVEALGKSNAGGTLRQLLRRELISLERDDADRKSVRYCTAPRFLDVFGLQSLDELPRSEDDLEFK